MHFTGRYLDKNVWAWPVNKVCFAQTFSSLEKTWPPNPTISSVQHNVALGTQNGPRLLHKGGAEEGRHPYKIRPNFEPISKLLENPF